MTYEYKYINNKKLVTLYNVNHNHINSFTYSCIFIIK